MRRLLREVHPDFWRLAIVAAIIAILYGLRSC
jgi:hypothetical protein